MSRQLAPPKSEPAASTDVQESDSAAVPLRTELEDEPSSPVPRYMRGNDLAVPFSPNYSDLSAKQADARGAVDAELDQVSGDTSGISAAKAQNEAASSLETGELEEKEAEEATGPAQEEETTKGEEENAGEEEPEEEQPASGEEKDQEKDGENEKEKEKEEADEAEQEGDGEGAEEAAAAGGGPSHEGGDEDDEEQMLLAVLPRMSPIRTPFVPSPPQPAMERRKEIIKRTGSPPELHHAQVRQAVERVAQAARDAQRRMIFALASVSKDTRLSIEEMADEILVVTAAVIGQVIAAIDEAVKKIQESRDAEIAHIGACGALTGEALQASQDSTVVKIFADLRNGSQDIDEAYKVIKDKLGEKIPLAKGLIATVPLTVKAARLTPPAGGKGGSPQGGENGGAANALAKTAAAGAQAGAAGAVEGSQYHIIGEATTELSTYLNSEAGIRGAAGPWTRQYMLDRSTPVMNALAGQTQINVIKMASDRAKELDSDATRDRFATIALQLTTPVSSHEKADKGKSVDKSGQAANEQLTEAQNATKRAQNVIEVKGAQAVEFCNLDLREKLPDNIRKSGRKVYKALRHQARAAEIALNNSAAPMAEGYRDLVDRLNALLPPNQFLNARSLVPQLMAARDSAEKMRHVHEALAEQQAAETVKQMEKVKEEQAKALVEAGQKSIENVQGIAIRSAFDFSLFSSEVTGQLSAGVSSGMQNARRYAEEVARSLVQTSQQLNENGVTQLEEMAIGYLNGSIDSAERTKYYQLKGFVERMETGGDEGILTKPMVDINSDLEKRATVLDNAMPGRSTGWSVGLMLGAPVIGAVYLYKTDPDESKVITQLGNLVWPGVRALDETFSTKNPTSLQERIRQELTSPEREHALNLFSESAAIRGLSRLSITLNSTGWFDYSREARESAAQGMTGEENAAVNALNPNLIAATAAVLTEELNANQAEIANSYLEHNRERAVAAKTREALDKGQREGMFGWIFSAEEAQKRSDEARVQVMGDMRNVLRNELAVEYAYIDDALLDEKTKLVYREFASLVDPLRRDAQHIEEKEAWEAMIAYATRGHAAVVLRPGLPTPGLMIPSLSAEIEQVGMSPQARQYISDVVKHGSESDEAKASRGVYEYTRADNDDKSGLSETSQTRLSDAFENRRLADLQRQFDEAPNALERSRIQPLLDEERKKHRARMQLIAKGLDAPPDVQSDPEKAERYVARRVGRMFARADSDWNALFRRSGTPSNYRYGQEMIMGGRASLAAGVTLATERIGTHEDLLIRSYTDRSKEEIKKANAQWAAEHGGEDMEVMLGIKKRPPDAWDTAALVAAPILGPGVLLANYFGRGPETSGDVAMQLELLAKGNRKTDLDHVSYAGLHYNQERVRGTGFIAEHTMQGTPEQQTLDARRDRLAQIILDEAAKRNPGAAAVFRDNPGALFRPDGSIPADIEAAAFEGGKFLGNRSRLHHYSQSINLAAESYRAEIDRQEEMWTTGITILALVVSVALMFIPGVNIAVAGIVTAVLAGAATMLVKAGMRGERYGWEEMATDLVSTGIEAATAGFGGALAGGLGKAGGLAKIGKVLTDRLGKVGAAIVREAVVSAINSGAQVALQDETWKDGLGRGLDRVFSGAVKGAVVAGISAGVSESVTKGLTKRMTPRDLDPSKYSTLQKIGRALGPHGAEAFREGFSELLGGLASQSVSVMTDYATGQFHGNFGDALKRIGESGLRDMVTGAMRGGAMSINRARYRLMLDAARQRGGDLSSSEMRALHLAAISAGAVQYGEGTGQLQAEIKSGRQLLSMMPPGLREHAANLDVDTLHKLMGMLDAGDLGTEKQRAEFLLDLSESVPGLDGRALMREMETVIAGRPGLVDVAAVPDTAEQSRVRQQLASGLDDSVKSALDNVRIEGLEHLKDVDLRLAAEMIGRGTFDSQAADALLRRAREANPDLHEYTFLRNLFGAVETSRQAQQIDRIAREQRRQDVLSMVPEEGRRLFTDMPDESITRVQDLLHRGSMGTPHEQEALFRAALSKDPELSREHFQRMLESTVDTARARQAEAKQEARDRREKQLLNVPPELRNVLSAMPEDALLDLRIRQLEGEPLSPAERGRLLDAARRETPGVDLKRLAAALDEAVATRPRDVAPEQEAKLRQELVRAVPAEQRGLLAEVAIVIMRDSEFEAFTRSASGQAVTLVIHGRPVVVMRESADASVLREEGIHVLQSKDPKWAERIGALDERKMADWDQLPLSEQLALYRNKVAIEIDAQRRLAMSLDGDLARATDPAELARLRAQLDMAHSSLRNLENRGREAGAIGDMDIRAMQAGLISRPDWLDQPARLFNKIEATQKAETERIKTEEEPTREELNQRLTTGTSDANGKRFISLAEKLPEESFRALIRASGGDPEIARSFLSRAGRSGDIVRFTDRLASVMDSLTPDQQLAVRQRAGGTTETLKTLIDAIDTLRIQPGSDGNFQRLVDVATRDGRIETDDLAYLTSLARHLTATEVTQLFAHAPDADFARKLVRRASGATDIGTFARQMTGVLDTLDGPQKIRLLDMTPEVLHGVVSGLSQLKTHVPNEMTYASLVAIVMNTEVHRVEVVHGLIDIMRKTDPRARQALASLLDQMDPSARNRVPFGLEWLRVSLEPIEQRLFGKSDGRLLNLVIETAATERNWIVFLKEAVDVLTALHNLPKTPQNEANIKKVLDYFSRSRGDANAPPKDFDAIRGNADLSHLAADLSAAAEAIRNSTNPEGVIDQQVRNLESPAGRLAGEDAWRTFLQNEALNWPALKTGEKTKDFASLLESVTSGWSDGERASLVPMQKWFDHLAKMRSIPENDIAGRKALLEEVLKQGFDDFKTRNLSSEGRYDAVARAFRETATKADPLSVPQKAHWDEALRRVGLTEESLAQRPDAKEIRQHLENLVRQEVLYTRMLALAGAEGVAGIKQNLTEVLGELALTNHMLKEFSGFRLETPFEKGTGFDQVWVKRDSSGRIVEVVIGEAKGPGATLGSPTKGKQMEAEWVVATINELLAHGSDAQKKLAKELLELAERSVDTPDKGLIRGRVVEAMKTVENGEVKYVPNNRTTPETGAQGYDFSGLL